MAREAVRAISLEEVSGRSRTQASPLSELSLRSEMLGGNTQPAVHRATTYHRYLDSGGVDKLVGLCRVDANEYPALTARSDSHVPADQEGQSPEHLLLG